MNLNKHPNLAVNKNSYNLRIFLLMFVLLLFFLLVGFRLFNLQVIKHAYYKELSDNQHSFTTTIDPKRGEIYFEPRNQEPLLVATNLTKDMVFAIPKEITDKKSAAN